MSYAALGPFGTVDVLDVPGCGHAGCGITSGEVDVVRFRLTGIDVATRAQALELVRAVGGTQAAGRYQYNVVGVALWKKAGSQPGDQMVDVIVKTPRVLFVPFVDFTSAEFEAQVRDRVKAIWPAVDVGEFVVGQLSGPAGAVSHWQAQGVLWDQKLSSPSGSGGPTDLFPVASSPEYAVVVGSADDGANAKPLVAKKGVGNGGKKDSGQVLFLVGLSVAAWLGWRALNKTKDKEIRS